MLEDNIIIPFIGVEHSVTALIITKLSCNQTWCITQLQRIHYYRTIYHKEINEKLHTSQTRKLPARK